MKVTTLIPDQIIEEVITFSKGKNITESLLIALKEWLALKKVSKLNQKIKKSPLEFSRGFSATSIRTSNRNR